MIKAVLHTNVFISSIFWNGAPYEIVRRGLGGAFRIVVSSALIAEVSQTLSNKFKFPPEDARAFLEVVVVHSHITDVTEHVHAVARDPSDNKIIECAISGDADYIVTGDRDLLDIRRYEGIRIVTSRRFLNILEKT